MTMFALIMAGGSGTRLWPASRKNTPKQLLSFVGSETLLQHTFSRLRKGFKPNEIFVATTRQYAAAVKKQLPQLPTARISIEPEMRERGPALGLAALIMQKRDPAASFITSWSDDFIKNDQAYHRTVKQAEKYLRDNPAGIIAIGVIPGFPHTGFRYIQQGSPVSNKYNIDLYKVRSFTEKPNDALAKKYFLNKGYLWNTGYFITTVSHFLKLYETYLPEVYKLLMEIKPFIGTKNQQKKIDEIYPKMPRVDFEEALIKHPQELLALPASFDWADVGRWKTVKEILSADKDNLLKGNVATVNTEGTLVYNYEPKLVAAVGLKDIIVVNTKDALLVMDKDDSELLKELINKLKAEKRLQKYL